MQTNSLLPLQQFLNLLQYFLERHALTSWRFFFQLDGAEGWGDDAFALNFGGGTGYAFLDPDRREGRFYWDCV